jgi:ferrochelatase
MVTHQRPATPPDAPAEAVLLLAYGGPESVDDVEPFLRDIRGGRETPDALIEEVRGRYVAIGGGSPLARRTSEQAAALEAALRAAGDPRPVRVGMRHWTPRIAETVQEIADEGIHELTAICLAPHYSRLSVGAYRAAVDDALDRCQTPMQCTFVDHWGDHPLLLRALAARAEAALAEFERPDGVAVVFTAHSLPAHLSDEGDPYVDELQRTARAVAERLGRSRARLAYQSAGARATRWLEPDLLQTLADLRAEGRRDVLVVPIGFVSDHVEILYDLDIEAQREATRLGLTLRRSEALNTHPDFVGALTDLAQRPLAWRLGGQ